MEEIRLLRKKLQTKKSELISSSSEVADRNLQSFLNFIESEATLSGIIDEIELKNYDWDAWKANLRGGLGGTSDYDIPVDDSEAAKFCFEVLSRNKEKVWNIASNFYSGSNSITDHIRKYLGIFVPPLYNYLDEKLQEAEVMISPVDIARDIMNTVEKDNNYKDINSRLSDAYKRLFVAKTNDDYIAISNICRAVLVDFASLIYKGEYLPDNELSPKSDDARAKMKYTFKALQKDKKSNFIKGQEKMIDALWQMISSNVHRNHILKNEIEECVLLTYLTIKIFIDLQSKLDENL